MNISTLEITKLEEMSKRKGVPTRSSSRIAQSQDGLESLEAIVEDDEEEDALRKQPRLQSPSTNSTVSSIVYLDKTYCYIKIAI